MKASESDYAEMLHDPDSADREFERLRTQVLLSWEKEARTLGWFGLQDGMSVLELGSGPGCFTEQLLALLPNSLIAALEISPVFVEKARQYLHQASERLTFVQASVMDTGLDANSFDFAIARLLFTSLSDPVDAAKEILRVLKPGGKLVIIDPDRDLRHLLEPSIPELDIVVAKIARSVEERGGDACTGRKLWRILQSAGFINLDLEAVVYHSDALSTDGFLWELKEPQVMQMVELGILKESEAGSIITSREKFLNAPNPFVLMLWLMACGEKPSSVDTPARNSN